MELSEEYKEHMKRLLEKEQQLETARRVLGLYDSPFPDSIELARREQQRKFIRHLEAERERLFNNPPD